jgi:hypothetical protein
LRFTVYFKTIERDGLPEGVNRDAFLGAAPYRPFNENRLHYKLHWFRDTDNGDSGNQEPHQTDIARWALNKMTDPVRTHGIGNLFLSGIATRKLRIYSMSILNMMMIPCFNSK